MDKIDIKKDLKFLYAPTTKSVSVVDVPPLLYLMIDGEGNPNTSPAYAAAVEALYAVAYAIKFRIKKSEAGIDYVVMPLEGLWWAEDMSQFSVARKDDWKWTMMILQPDRVTDTLVVEVMEEVQKKKSLPALPNIRLETYHEGQSAQLMHIGPYAAEAPNITKIHAHIHENGYQLRGKHHEIYLSDPRKCAPETMKTVIRQPFFA